MRIYYEIMLNITSGSLIQLESAIKTHNATFLVEIVQRDVAKNVNKTLLATAKNPYLRLHLHTSGPVYKEVSSPNRDCLVHIEEVFGDNAQISYRLFTYADGKQTTRNYLAWSDNEGLAVLPIEKQDDTELHVNRSFTLFAISVVNHISSSPFPTVLSPTASLHSSSPITKKQLRDLAIHGYLVLPNIVNQTKVSQCSGYFLHHVGQVGFLIPGAVQGGGYGKFPGSMSQSKVIKELFTTELKQVVEHVLGGDIDQINNLNTQIAFRFPELPPHGKSRDSSMIVCLQFYTEWHVDGYRQGISHSFSLLVGICLSDVDQEYSGNLCVWPGSHFLLHRCKVGPHGDLDVKRITQQIDNDDIYADFRSKSPMMPSQKVVSQTAEVLGKRPDLPCLGFPDQVKLKAGDVVFLHPDLAHGGAPNYSSSIRQMMYFRVRLQSESWPDLADIHMQDMWVDLQGVKSGLGKELEQLQVIYYPSDK